MKTARTVADLTYPEIQRDHNELFQAMVVVENAYNVGPEQVLGFLRNGSWEDSRICRDAMGRAIKRVNKRLEKR